jgi:hypothetical protein
MSKSTKNIDDALSRIFQSPTEQPNLSKVKKSKPDKLHFLKLKVLLKGIKPSIERSFGIPNHFTFSDLHEVL